MSSILRKNWLTETPGVLATVDEQGMPHLRWMATLSLHDWPRLYTITSPTVENPTYQAHPSVSWMFSNNEMNSSSTFEEGRIATDVVKMQHVWKLLEDKSKAYF